ncbi:hypothetical protein M231_02406 [Tremella mesenterica]|uniref:Uncharacterized protein n=1 Tax=Tremella mesenterica TaxID=5217 RepID=A0A4Q1BR15_TREME|nr:hypothetical protein M231_02406 [Tremella mesenterica]
MTHQGYTFPDDLQLNNNTILKSQPEDIPVKTILSFTPEQEKDYFTHFQYELCHFSTPNSLFSPTISSPLSSTYHSLFSHPNRYSTSTFRRPSRDEGFLGDGRSFEEQKLMREEGMSTFLNISNQDDMKQNNHIRSCASFNALSCLTCGNQVRGDHWHHGFGFPGDTVICYGPCAWSHMQDAMSVVTASVEVKEQGAELEEDGEEEGFNDDSYR